jgi:hypothetical protein
MQHAVHMHYNSKISNFNARCIILYLANSVHVGKL